jgi:hypothetical protein
VSQTGREPLVLPPRYFAIEQKPKPFVMAETVGYLFMNYAVWESVDHFRQAFTHPEFRNHIADYPSSAVASPHLFEKMAVPNICVA